MKPRFRTRPLRIATGTRAASSALLTAFQTTTTEAQIMHMPIAGGRPQDSTRFCGEKTEKGAEATGDFRSGDIGWGRSPHITRHAECRASRSSGTFLRWEP